MVFKALNDSTSPNGFISTFLVFKAYSQLINPDTLSLTISQKANALKKAIKEIKKLQAEC